MTGVLHSDDGFPQLVFRFVAAFGPSVRIGPSIILGSALTYQSLFFFRACVCTRPPFLTGSPIRTRPLLIVAHGGISTDREAAPLQRLRLLGGDSETNRNCRAAPAPVTSGESGTKPAPNRNMVSASDGAPDIVDHMGLRSSRSSWPISEY
jgi:hypothetical protein